MPITEALKKLIKTITGKDASGETIEELVTNLAENYSGTAHNEADIFLNVGEQRATPYDLQALLDVWNERPIVIKAFDLGYSRQTFYSVSAIKYQQYPTEHISVELLDDWKLGVYPDGSVTDESVD